MQYLYVYILPLIIIASAGGDTNAMGKSKNVDPGDVYGSLRDLKLAAPAEGSFLSKRGFRQMFAK